jgi:diacylglycerol kinase (ATP)
MTSKTILSKAVFIINPIAGKVNSGKIVHQLKKSIPQLKDSQIMLTRQRGDGRDIAAAAVKKNIHFVFAIGGDGTVNEVAAGLLHSQTNLGIVPMGSGNGLANALGLKSAIRSLPHQYQTFTIRSIDTGQANEHLFLATSGLGFSALVATRYADLKRRGAIPYFYLSFRHFFSHRVIPLSLTIDGLPFAAKVFEFTIANTREFGNGARIAPMADPEDGLLDVVTLAKVPLVSVPQTLIRLFNGRLRDTSYLHYRQAGTIQADGIEAGTLLHCDGEPKVINTTKIRWQVKPGSLNVIIPGASDK